MENDTKYGLLVVSPSGNNKNIGDYIQSIAQRQFLPRVDTYIQREKISLYTNEKKEHVALIMNAWYMWNSENWPPSELIVPLPISMHLSPIGYNGMLTEDSIAWFKRHESIGCRDLDTMRILQSKGVKAYFSGCLTLTLNHSYPIVEAGKRKGVCFVNPYIPVVKGMQEMLQTLLYVFVAPCCILTLYTRNKQFFSCGWNSAQPERKHRFLKALSRTSHFYKIYSQKFTNRTLLDAEYINHTIDVKVYSTDEVLFDLADQLLKKYAKKKIVVTSRIHAGLPCLSLETPVVYVEHPGIVGDTFNGKRTEGLSDLFHKMTIAPTGKLVCDEIFNGTSKIDETFDFENKQLWKRYAKQLQTQCQHFIESIKKRK